MGKTIPSDEWRKIYRFLFHTFSIAWSTEFLLIAAYHFKILSGGLGLFFHFATIAFGAGLAPAYAAFIVKKRDRAITLRKFCKQIFYTDNLRRTVFFTALFSIMLWIVCFIQETYLGNPWYYWFALMFVLVFGGGLEEIGWRGFFQPLLERRFPFFTAAIIQSIVWSIWHLPLWLVPDSMQSSYNFIAFSLYCITFGCTLAAVHRLTKSIWASVLVHVWGSLVLGGMYTVTTLINFPSIKTLLIYTVQMLLIVVICKIYDPKRRSET
jgi:uncharacterized protein